MANFTITTRLQRENGEIVFSSDFVPVYISVAHNSETRYINTGLKTHVGKLKKSYNRLGNETYEVNDFFVLKECMQKIDDFMNRCNSHDVSQLSCKELVDFLKKDESSLSFRDFANLFIRDMINQDRDRPARNYKSAVNNFFEFIGHDRITFQDITSKLINRWIKTLLNTKRAKQMYPAAIKTIFKAGADYYNDYDKGVLYIKNDPFRIVNIPRASLPKKRSIRVEKLREFFDYPVQKYSLYMGKEVQSRESLAKEVCTLVFYLAGINVADLYDMDKSCLQEDYLCYERKKTRTRRDDGAYIEIKVPEEILPLFDKHKGERKLFAFAERYSSNTSFCRAVNLGLNDIAKAIQLDNLTTYTFRHSWATVAQNHCGASIADIAFALNHASKHRVTERYIDIDYSPIDELNRKVIDYVFNGLEHNK